MSKIKDVLQTLKLVGQAALMWLVLMFKLVWDWCHPNRSNDEDLFCDPRL